MERYRTDAGTLEWDAAAQQWVQKEPTGEDVSGLTYMPPDALSDVGADKSLQGGPPARPAGEAWNSIEYDATPSPMRPDAVRGQPPPVSRPRPGVRVGEAAKGAAPRMHESLAALAPNGPRAEMASSRTAVAGDGAMPEKPEDLRMAEEILAMKQGGNNRMWAQLQRAAGNFAGALGGTKVDSAPYDAMDAEAGRPMADLQARRGMEADATKREQAQRHADPASPESRAAQEVLRGIIGDTPAIARMPYAQIVRDFPMIAKQADMEAKRLEHETARADRNAAREDQQRATWENSEANRANARLTAGMMSHAMGAQKQERAFEADVQRAGKDTEGVARIAQDMALLDKMANTSGAIPGAGMMDSRLPGFLQSGEDIDVQQAAMRVAARLLSEQSGASVTPSEAQRFMAGRGLGPGATEEQWKRGVKALTTELRDMLAAKQAKYRPEVMQALRERGGFTADQLPNTGGQDAAAVQWARDNPNDPRAAEILRLNGVQ